MKRFVAAAGAFAGALGAIVWVLLLLSTAADTVVFSRNYPALIGLNLLLAAGMLLLVGWQLRSLWRDYRMQVFGARLKLRLMFMFGIIAVLPGALVYGVSVQFVTRSIESWFDVRVEKALESGLHLGRSALDSLLAELAQKGESMTNELADVPEAGRRSALLRLREEKRPQRRPLRSQRTVARQCQQRSQQPLPAQPADAGRQPSQTGAQHQRDTGCHRRRRRHAAARPPAGGLAPHLRRAADFAAEPTGSRRSGARCRSRPGCTAIIRSCSWRARD